MRPQSFLKFPISLILILSTAGPFSYAAPTPAPLPADGKIRYSSVTLYIYTDNLKVEVPSVLVSAHGVIPDPASLEAANITTTSQRLVRRGCFSSKPEDGGPDIGPLTCDGSIPPATELAVQIQRQGNVGTKVSAFYTRLDGASAIKTCKCWVNTHPDQIPFPPGAVFFDEIVSREYEQAVGSAMMSNPGGLSKLTSYQKLLSQVFAEQSRGTVWIFAPADLDFETLDDLNTWYVL